MLEGVGRESMYLILRKCWVNLHVCFFSLFYVCRLKMCVDMDKRNGSSNSDEDEDGKERPVFSLLTGTYRHPKRYGDGKPLPSS